MSAGTKTKRAKESPLVDEVLDDILATSEKVREIDARIAMLKMELREQNQKRKSAKGFLRKAKSIYYHENKTRSDILKDVKERLEKAGLYIISSGKPVIPWRIIREYTDREFDLLSTEVMRKYLIAAVDA